LFIGVRSGIHHLRQHFPSAS